VQTRNLLLELFAHLSEVFRNLIPCFDDCRTDDFLEKLGMIMQNYLQVPRCGTATEDGFF
jgi:hypothetical protein